MNDYRLDNDDEYRDIYDMVTNLTCPRCDAFVLVYHSPKDEEDKKGTPVCDI